VFDRIVAFSLGSRVLVLCAALVADRARAHAASRLPVDVLPNLNRQS
jgi:Cu/Ag efflux pump CusA